MTTHPWLAKSMILPGDALELLRHLPDNSVDAVVTDPPYLLGASQGGGVHKNASFLEEIRFMSNGFDQLILDEVLRVLKKVNVYLFCSRKQIPLLLDYFVRDRGCNWELLSWHKSNPTPACGNKYLSDTEYVMFFRDKGVRLRGRFSTKSTYYVTTKNVRDKRLYGHPTVKPLHMVENFIINSTQPGDVVLDPFVGSGTTVVAADRLGRIGVGMEREPKFVDVARKRLRDSQQERAN
jgi:site-specific DNA-methyltransferase (adenine-specific)